MIYYRLAVQDNDTSKWQWKSTILTSLVSVLHLLRMYSSMSPERIRVFSATCAEELPAMLNRENDGMVSGSLTAGEFLRERRLSVQNVAASNSIEKLVRHSIAVAVESSARNNDPVSNNTGMGSISLLDQRRLSVESGPGGDHDIPYQFSLPTSTPQLLAWTRLMGKVQAGEIQP